LKKTKKKINGKKIGKLKKKVILKKKNFEKKIRKKKRGEKHYKLVL
jgi:hypothetical protein